MCIFFICMLAKTNSGGAVMSEESLIYHCAPTLAGHKFAINSPHLDCFHRADKAYAASEYNYFERLV